MGMRIWFLKEEVKVVPAADVCLPPIFIFFFIFFIMNSIVWNCRGACKPSFQKHIGELVRSYNPAILVIMETRVGGDRAKRIIDRLPFDGSFHTDSIGFAGGIWMLWDSERVDVSPLANTEQEIHASVKVRNANSSWLFTAVYASPRTAERLILWNNLIKTAELHNMPWVLAGDFNEPLSAEDKFGGRVVSVNRSLLFKECLDKCNMIDVGFSGPRFTWSNRREVQALIQERIDRVFVNPSWCLLYPEARVVHLTRCHSDHCPILLEMQPRINLGRKRPFRFQTCWLSEPSFPSIVSRAWSDSSALGDAVNRFTQAAIRWNASHFGNIFTRK